jgi:FkbM family methyltransferase
MMHPGLWPVAAYGVLPALEHRHAFHGLEFDVVVDVGANKGQFAAFAAARWPAASLICFEPLPGPRHKLKKVLSRIASGRFDIRAKALGSTPGESVMHVATREDSSSLLNLGEAQCRLFDMKQAGTETVPVSRLDNEPGVLGQGRTLLKIDVQGFEYETLSGAGPRLQEFDAVYVECSFIELYVGQKLAPEVTEMLGAHGFSERGRFNACYDGDVLVQADLLMMPTASK